ncbi:MAG: hypothetical protein HY893_02770 [Deltaproteobacteria bacterium]|nr:hypothetical protein [Deltaproteobacteria bacterium]
MRINRSILLVLLLVFSGCGYHIAGRGGKMPGGITSLSIPVFTNNTAKPDIEAPVTSAFVNEFVNTVVVKDKGDAVMSGVIKSYSLTAVSYTKSDVNQEYRLAVVMSVKIVRQGTGEVLWEDDNVIDTEDFTVNIGNVTATKEAEDEALKKISRDTARAIKERIVNDF